MLTDTASEKSAVRSVLATPQKKQNNKDEKPDSKKTKANFGLVTDTPKPASCTAADTPEPVWGAADIGNLRIFDKRIYTTPSRHLRSSERNMSYTTLVGKRSVITASQSNVSDDLCERKKLKADTPKSVGGTADKPASERNTSHITPSGKRSLNAAAQSNLFLFLE